MVEIGRARFEELVGDALDRLPERFATAFANLVMHEIGHHFGIDDDRLHELGW